MNYARAGSVTGSQAAGVSDPEKRAFRPMLTVAFAVELGYMAALKDYEDSSDHLFDFVFQDRADDFAAIGRAPDQSFAEF